MTSVDESLFITQFLAAYSSLPTKYPSNYISPGLAPNLTSKRVTFERPPKPVKPDAPQGSIQVVIKSLKAGQWTVDVPAQGTISDLKEALQAKAGINVGSQRLLLKGKALVDNKTLEEYGLISGSIVHLFSKAGASSTASSVTEGITAPASSTQESESSTNSGATASAPKKSSVTSYRGLSEQGTAIAKEAEFWHWLNDQLKDKLGSKEDSSLMLKGFLGQYRDLVGNANTKEIEKQTKA
ncbi:hypothetical protein BGZ76_009233 [Entomortierella beljakovae]|nr:hypothetical protein BGZ76_009233 [Entomortierella beljakovae]